jgi:hypothetical protein
MDSSSARSRAHQFACWATAVASVFITSMWVAVGAVAPEFIWQGLRTAYEHPDWSDLLSALLIGLILAFFVEPATERVRDLLRLARTKTDFIEGRPRNVFFTACLSLAFALTSVGLHHAMSAFISGHGEGAEGVGIKAGISLTTEWAFVPFAMMIGWQSVRLRWLAVPTGMIALASPAIAGWLFGWSTRTILEAIIPCAIVLALGYRAVAQPPADRAFTRCARIVATVGVVWVGAALVIYAVLDFFHLNPFKPYSASDVLTDVRFYFGWTLGLLLAPYPAREAAGRETVA